MCILSSTVAFHISLSVLPFFLSLPYITLKTSWFSSFKTAFQPKKSSKTKSLKTKDRESKWQIASGGSLLKPARRVSTQGPCVALLPSCWMHRCCGCVKPNVQN
ncbi:hypothetical protein VIGAN_04122200 [Vigna angularis var. angularis]|uniref:Uncharacterized protein n=1 Tax=Vigna angularis var. angularis TaxID=157739 RepID=A0A0S3RTS5_PHAAN|nr:hypothetical protein VIGAN_04122200 [Vigna angularis var. angularis]